MTESTRRQLLAEGGSWLAGGALAPLALGHRPRRGITGSRRPPRSLRAAVRGEILSPGNPAFAAAAHVYNQRFDASRPRAVVRPLDRRDVRDAVAWAVAYGVPMRARSGGHSYAGYSTLNGGLVLDLRRLAGVRVDRAAGLAHVGAGAQLIDVNAGLAAAGAVLPGGSCPSVGIAGVTLGGGVGLAGRALGLTCDHLVGAEIVTANGRIRSVDHHSDPHLLWALRGGGGGNFGVVTRFTFRIDRIPPRASYFFVDWPWSQADAALAAWQAWAPHARDELTSILHLEAAGANRVAVSGQYLGPASDLGHLLAPLRGVAGASVFIGEEGYLAAQMRFAGCTHLSRSACHTRGAAPGGTLDRASFSAGSDYVARPLDTAGRAALIRSVVRRAGEPGSGAALLDAYGGRINRVHRDATAFIHRNQLFCIQYLSYGAAPGWVAQARAALHRHVSGQAYQNYIDRDLARWQRAYYGSAYPRLLEVRRRVDPDHRFTFPQAIGR